MSDEDSSRRGPGGRARQRWVRERTTFQRVYDVVTGLTAFESASGVAERANCSDDGARDALAQLVEMGIVEERDGRPVAYRRNDSYFQWKRIERLASENDAGALRDRVDELVAEDDAFQDRFDAPDPNSIAQTAFETMDHDEIHDRWDAITRWRSVRHDIEILQQAAYRAAQRDGSDTGDAVSV
ncbi:DUF7342 family protein [Halovivax gelatinilyticus]|uniref:DUF7342 family protein n=1 Tax=Halovivax gelatinilyticus TaxID=2961597 RepID=UPI0020CA4040|nr:hypothetical protein [Halovivax gelatinilyticus]